MAEERIVVEIAGQLDALQKTLDQARSTLRGASSQIQAESSKLAGAFEGMGHRFEHTGVMAAFAISNLATGSERGMTRVAHSIAMLGFAWGPVIGLTTTAVALLLEQVTHLVTESKKQLEDYTKSLAQAANSGDVAGLQKQLQDLLVGTPLDPETGKARAKSELVPGAWKGSLMDLRAEMERVSKSDPLGPEHARRYAPFHAELEKAEEEFKAITAAMDAASAAMHTTTSGLPAAKITADSPEAAQRKQKEAIDKRIAAMFQEQKIEDSIADESMKSADRAADAAIRALDRKVAAQDEAAKHIRDWDDQQKRLQAQTDAATQGRLDEAKAQHLAYIEQVRKGYEQMLSVVSRTLQASVDGLVAGTTTVADAWHNMLRNIYAQMIANVEKSLEVWIASELLKRKYAEATGKTMIFADAYHAAAATYASISEIPVVGPFLAPAAAAAAFAAVLAFGSGLSSAAGGYDIPAGVNPVTQLHAKEMVLPAELAESVRQNVGGRGGGGMVVHIHAMDAASFETFAHRHADTFHDAVMVAAASGRGT